MPGFEKKTSSLGWFSSFRKTKRKFLSVSDQIEIKFELEPVIGDKILTRLKQEKTLIASQGSNLTPITYKIMVEIIQAYRYSDGSEADLLKTVNLSDKLTFNLILPSSLHKLESKSFYKKSLKELFDALNTPQIREIANCFSKGIVIESLESLLPGMCLDFQELQAFLLQIEKQIYDILSSESHDLEKKNIIREEQERVSNEITKIEKLIVGRDENDTSSEFSSNSFEHQYEEICSGDEDKNLICSGDSGYVSADTYKNEIPIPKPIAIFFIQDNERGNGSVKNSSVSEDSGDDTYMAMNGKKLR